MGLIKEIVLAPIAPLRFTAWVAEQVAEEADRRQYSSAAGVQRIAQIEEARQQGDLDEERAEEMQGEVIEEQAGRPQAEGQEQENEQDQEGNEGVNRDG